MASQEAAPRDLLKIVEFYAGIGGFHCALRESRVRGEIVASIDINTNTTKVYSHNFPHTLQLNRNICGMGSEELDKLGADVFFLSPPCQPFTRQGNQLDDKDRRTDSFFHLMHTLTEMQLPPRYLLMENVKGFECSHTRDQFVGVLKGLDYDVCEYLLSPNQFGIPNSRLRFYLLAQRKPMKFPAEGGGVDAKPSEDAGKLMECIWNRNGAPVPIHSPDLEQDLEQVLNIGSKPPETDIHGEAALSVERSRDLSGYLQDLDSDALLQRFLVPDKILQRYAVALDIVRESSTHSCCFTKGYGNYAVGTGSILQHSLDEQALKQAFLEFSDLQAGKDLERDVACLRGLNLRYFTPREVANLMCFPSWFGFPSGLTDRQCYKALGNSLNVKVVGILIKYLLQE